MSEKSLWRVGNPAQRDRWTGRYPWMTCPIELMLACDGSLIEPSSRLTERHKFREPLLTLGNWRETFFYRTGLLLHLLVLVQAKYIWFSTAWHYLPQAKRLQKINVKPPFVRCGMWRHCYVAVGIISHTLDPDLSDIVGSGLHITQLSSSWQSDPCLLPRMPSAHMWAQIPVGVQGNCRQDQKIGGSD